MTDENEFVEKYKEDQATNVVSFDKITGILESMKSDIASFREELDEVKDKVEEPAEEDTPAEEPAEETPAEDIKEMKKAIGVLTEQVKKLVEQEDSEEDDDEKKKKKKDGEEDEEETPPKEPEKPKQESKENPKMTEGVKQKMSFKEALDKHYE